MIWRSGDGSTAGAGRHTWPLAHPEPPTSGPRAGAKFTRRILRVIPQERRGSLRPRWGPLSDIHWARSEFFAWAARKTAGDGLPCCFWRPEPHQRWQGLTRRRSSVWRWGAGVKRNRSLGAISWASRAPYAAGGGDTARCTGTRSESFSRPGACYVIRGHTKGPTGISPR